MEQKIIDRISKCAVSYLKLCDKEIAFIYERDNLYHALKIEFLRENFFHLLAIDTTLSFNEFFDLCLQDKLKEYQVSLAKGKKLKDVIEKLDNFWIIENIKTASSLIGNYNNSRISLKTNKLIGNLYSVVGFVKNKRKLVPNTSLSLSIKELSNKQFKILMILEKQNGGSFYKIIRKCSNYEKILKQLKLNYKEDN